jgi:hypothetical protein
MAYRFEREKTPSTPYILIDEERAYIKLAGKSFHENVVEHFKELIEWIDEFLETDFAALTLECRLEYFNSSTAKLLWNLLMDMDDSKNAANITVNWISSKSNVIVTELGNDYKEDMEALSFNLLAEE